jgi:hypothetical protein
MSCSQKQIQWHVQDEPSIAGDDAAGDGVEIGEASIQGDGNAAALKLNTSMSCTSMSSSQQHLHHVQDQSCVGTDLGACESRGIACDSRGRRGDHGSLENTFASETSMSCSAHVQLDVQDKPRRVKASFVTTNAGADPITAITVAQTDVQGYNRSTEGRCSASTEPITAITVAQTDVQRCNRSTDGSRAVVDKSEVQDHGSLRRCDKLAETRSLENTGHHIDPLVVAKTYEDCGGRLALRLELQALKIIQDKDRCEAVAVQCTRGLLRMHSSTSNPFECNHDGSMYPLVRLPSNKEH